MIKYTSDRSGSYLLSAVRGTLLLTNEKNIFFFSQSSVAVDAKHNKTQQNREGLIFTPRATKCVKSLFVTHKKYIYNICLLIANLHKVSHSSRSNVVACRFCQYKANYFRRSYSLSMNTQLDYSMLPNSKGPFNYLQIYLCMHPNVLLST